MEHQASVKAMQNLAVTCRNHRDCKKTETIERSILEIKQRLLGDHEAEVLDALKKK